MAARKKSLKSLEPKTPYVPTHEDPYAQLRLLVKQHKAATKSKVKIQNMTTDKKARQDIYDRNGVLRFAKDDVMPCLLPEDVKATLLRMIDGDASTEAAGMDSLEKQLGRLEREMAKELKNVPIYNVFLSKVFACGPITSSYLASEIDIRICTKVSNLIRFCGLAVINGKLEQLEKGKPRKYHVGMRTAMYMMFASNLPKAQRHIADDLEGRGKYFKIMKEKKHGLLSRAPDENGKMTTKGEAQDASWHSAARVFLEDLYIVWRTLEGLPVWPSYRAAKLGYSHGGKVCVDEPRILTLPEALEAVGMGPEVELAAE